MGPKGTSEIDTTWGQRQQIFSDDGDNRKKGKYHLEVKNEYENWFEDEYDILQVIRNSTTELRRILTSTSI